MIIIYKHILIDVSVIYIIKYIVLLTCSDLGPWLTHSLVNEKVAGSIPRIPVRHK